VPGTGAPGDTSVPEQTEDLAFARAACAGAGVPFEARCYREEYAERVLVPALDQPRKSRTPSPDRPCNRLITFGSFFEHTRGFLDAVATGHYACLEKAGRTERPGRLANRLKDQTYFLSLPETGSMMTLGEHRGHWFYPSGSAPGSGWETAPDTW
jgi:tRNA U34 2-thiouridine synthase MnmA/TrmU